MAEGMGGSARVRQLLRGTGVVLALLLWSAGVSARGNAAAATSGAPPAVRRILVVFACHPIQPVCAESLSAMQEVTALEPTTPVELYAEYLDEGRLGPPADPAGMARHLVDKYAQNPPDVVLADGDTVIDLFTGQRATLWPGVPVIAFALAEGAGRADDAANHIVRLAPPAEIYKPGETVAAALRMLPGTRRVVYVGGRGPIDQVGLRVFRQQMRDQLPAVPIVEVMGLTLPETFARVGSLPSDSLVYTFGIVVDGDGRRHVPQDTARRIIAAANRPVFVLRRNTIGTGAVGGVVSDATSGARQAMRAALTVLNGGDPRRVPEADQPRPTYDWRQLRRWGIDDATLPPGSLVLYREPTFFQRYRWWVLLAAAQLALIAGLLVERRHRQRAAKAASESESLNRSVLASLPGRIAVLDAHGTVLQVNADWQRQGHDPGAPITRAQPGDSVPALLSGTGDEVTTLTARLSEAVRSVLDGRLPQATLEFPDTDCPDPRWYRWLVQALDRPEGGAILSLFDVTERKRVELEGRRTLQEMAHAARVVSLGELTSSLAHEINQPLAAILTNAEAGVQVLTAPQPNLAVATEILGEIADSSERAGEVIRRMRTMLRKGDAQREPVHIARIVTEVKALLAPEAQLRRVQLHADVADELPRVSGDPVQLQQVVLNLVVNALDAIGDDRTRPHAVLIRVRAEASTIVLSVIDDGPGIPDAVMPQLFEPFFTTKAKGLGVGLAIIRSIVEAHGGTITARNNDGPGATLRCVLPASA